MDPLAEMHLLLREHGWEPESDESIPLNFPDVTAAWNWRHPQHPEKEIQTVEWCEWSDTNDRTHPAQKPSWTITGRDKSTSVASLRRRLKELAH
jgi:hypothetical protein